MTNEIPKFTIHYAKHKTVQMSILDKSGQVTSAEDIEAEYSQFRIESVQNYNPIYDLWFTLDESNYNRISLNHAHHLVDMNTVVELKTKAVSSRPVFIKYSPLLDPIRYMVGKYESCKQPICNLPSLTNENVHMKIQDYNNMAYVDGFFSYLSSQLLNTHNFMHGVDFYGSFTGIQEQYKMDITDDYDYLQCSAFFNKNNKILFKTSHVDDGYFNYGSHGNKPRLQVLETPKRNISAVIIEDLISPIHDDISPPTDANTETELVYTNPNVESKNGSRNTSSSSDDSSSSQTTATNTSCDSSDCENNSSSEESVWDTDDDENSNDDEHSNDDSEYDAESDDDADDDDDDDSYTDPDACYAYIKNFPVHCIALQKCDGTLDSLFSKNALGKEEGTSALMQIVMTLLCYQNTFQFTHNDLHTNNIMYVNTTDPFLYYTYKRKIYKVPTFGKIIKIIDFGRAIYNYNGRRLCSDSFAPLGDASTQYNCEPYMDVSKPRLDPNFSFDLCRLGCSLYDFVIDDDDNPKFYDDLQQLIHDWCLDDNKKNILYKQNGDERYPNFKLYKMIARTVHNQTPEHQLSRNIFKQYIVPASTEVQAHVHMNIDKMPEYYTKYV
jgi:hypothetical protein